MEIGVLQRSTHRTARQLFRTAGGLQTFLVILEYFSLHYPETSPCEDAMLTFEGRNLSIVEWKSKEVV